MSLRYALMGLLADRPASGYDLLKRFGRSLDNVWTASQSQVYGELRHLADSGAIEVVSEGPRGRKEYALTPRGQAELREWVAHTEGGHSPRNAMLLQVFFLGLLARDEAAERLARKAEEAAEQHAALVVLQESLDWGDGENLIDLGGRLALEYGLRLRAMEKDWARWAVAQTTGPAGRADGSRGACPPDSTATGFPTPERPFGEGTPRTRDPFG
ncbi:PadR family transcriptional regulator [Streptomyces sp. TS71-3]|uniref:PadR family transcriptional regulator n=1 Tax=Streptomyces sp. TS71-3 TaxID=2733862 RepID=UPI001B2F735F|nr:PadR family transcriptional regulator [Streptomyces sp. TS71-3]GHJ37155.1 PadR family transcriptional regulator [Streptomyces sp. TS71-3]